MSKYYNCDEIKNGIMREIEECKAYKKAWESVTFPTKKDGSPYATLSKNINGAKLYTEPYNCDYEKKLVIYTTAGGAYVHDEIYLYETLAGYRKFEKAEEKPQNIIKRPPFCDCYVFDLDDIKESVQLRIESLSDRIADLNLQLANLEADFAELLTAYKQAMQVFDKLYDKYGGHSSYYAITETIKNHYKSL